MKIKISKLPQSLVEIEGELESDVFETYFRPAIKRLGEKTELPGFRKGKIPENILSANIPEIKILEEMAELALSEHYPKILEEEKIDAVGRPEISVTKLARKNPLGFKIKTAVLPEIKLPDYKKIAKEVLEKEKASEKDKEVTDKELEDVIMDIRKSRAPKKHIADPSATGKESAADDAKEELPELNDDFVRGLGPFKDVADFKEKLRENLRLEKANQEKEKVRLKIVEKIIEESKMETPEILIGLELDKILYKMESDIAQMGLKFEDYLKHLNKTAEDLRREFRGDAEKKAKLALILNEIAKLEKVAASEAEVASEVAHILEHYKDADRERVRAHAENVLVNEKIFQLLENQ